MEKNSTFTLIKQVKSNGPYYNVTMCSKTLQPLEIKLMDGLPDEWSTNDFYDYLEEGRRFNIDLSLYLQEPPKL